MTSDEYREHLVPLLPGKKATDPGTATTAAQDNHLFPEAVVLECAHGFFVSPCLRRELR